ncbi:MAG: hypothetical protein AAF791_03530 [Bacteroidota bacterium]
MIRLALVALLVVAAPSLSAQERTVADQSGAPIQISQYVADYGAPRGREPAIAHGAEYQNKSGKAIAAVQIGFVSIDAFGTVMAHETATVIASLRDGQTGQAATEMRPPDAAGYMSGFVYVRKARSADGTVWEADYDAVAAQLRQPAPEANAALLRD